MPCRRTYFGIESETDQLTRRTVTQESYNLILYGIMNAAEGWTDDGTIKSKHGRNGEFLD